MQAQQRAKIADQEYRVVDVAKLKEHPRNKRRGRVDVIEESVLENDFYGAIVVQKSTGFVIAGNHRLKAAVATKMKRVPVIFVDCDDVAATRILLVDNRANDLAKNDDQGIFEILRELSGSGSIAGTGYSNQDLERFEKASTPPPEFPAFDETINVHFTCPKCHYEWSGGKKEMRKGPKQEDLDG